MMKWFISIVLILAIAVAGFVVWVHSGSIPAGFRTSPLAWIDQYKATRAIDALDHRADPATYQEQLEGIRDKPEVVRYFVRQHIGLDENWARDGGGYLLGHMPTTGPRISLLESYPLDRAFEPNTNVDTRAIFTPLLGCEAALPRLEAATSFDLEAWTMAGAPPTELIARAEAGDLDAQYDLGLGATYLEDATLAAELAPWLDRAAEAGHVAAMTVRGAELISEGDMMGPPNEQGLSYLEAAIEEGSLIAMSLAAYAAPREGEDLHAFAEKRLNWEMQAAAACEPSAMFRIGWRLATGRGLPRDRDLGLDIAVASNYGPQIFDEIEGLRLTAP